MFFNVCHIKRNYEAYECYLSNTYAHVGILYMHDYTDVYINDYKITRLLYRLTYEHAQTHVRSKIEYM